MNQASAFDSAFLPPYSVLERDIAVERIIVDWYRMNHQSLCPWKFVCVPLIMLYLYDVSLMKTHKSFHNEQTDIA